MNIMLSILFVIDIAALIVVLVIGYNGLVRLATSLLRLANYAETLHNSQHERLLDADSLMPVSLILPDCSKEDDPAAAVKELLALEYPEYEVIAVCNGEADGTLGSLVDHFGMVEILQPIKRSLPMQDVRRVYRSPAWPGLIVLDKASGGRYDALNAGVNVSRFPLVAVLAAGTRIRRQGLAELTTPFARSHRVVAVGSLPRVDGTDGMARGPLASLQQAEYLSTFPAGLAVPGQKKLPIIPGAFGLFRKQTVIERGGFDEGSSETEMVVTLHRKLTERSIPHEIELLADPVLRSQPPRGLGGLFRQRRRWQKQIMSTLWHNKGMMLNPMYGTRGTLDMLYYWFFEVIAPILELVACIAIPLSVAFGAASPILLFGFLAAEVLFGIVVSLAGVVSQQILESDSPKLGRLLNLLICSILTNIGYRQLLLVFRVVAMFLPNPDKKHS